MSGAAQPPYAFRDPALLRRALAVPEPNRRTPDNQRLEFLGDAVLELLVSERLYALHPAADEGRLTAMRAALVSTAALLARGALAPDALLIFETDFRTDALPIPGFTLLRDREYGKTRLAVYRRA